MRTIILVALALLAAEPSNANSLTIADIPDGLSSYSFSVSPSGIGDSIVVSASFTADHDPEHPVGGVEQLITIYQFDQDMNLIASNIQRSGGGWTPSNSTRIGNGLPVITPLFSSTASILLTDQLTILNALSVSAVFTLGSNSTISQTPLPPAWTMMGFALLGAAFLLRGRLRQTTQIPAA